MRGRQRRLVSLAVTLAVTAGLVGIASPAMAVFLRPGIPSGNGVTPVVQSGFAGCPEGLTTYTWQGDDPGTQETTDGLLEITISRTGENLPGTDNRYVDFSVEGGEVSRVVVLTEVFIIGFITESNVYNYMESVASDTRLHPPTDHRDRPFKIDGFRFCYEPTLDISGRVFEDLNANGNDEGGSDPGLSGEPWTVTLHDGEGAVIDSATPAEDGSYSFGDLTSGTYSVCQTPPEGEGWIESTPEGGCHTDIGTSTSDADFGRYQTGSISGTVLIDANGDGSLAGDTTGLAGSTVTANGESAVSGEDGTYSITGLTPGTYDVCQDPPDGWTQSVPPAEDCHLGVVVESGGSVGPFDFGNFQPGSISGTRLINDEGFPGQTVRLLNSEGTEVGSTTTGDDGSFEFPGLTPGDYTVCTGNVAPGTMPSGPPSEECDEGEVGSDVTVGSGQTVIDIDFSDEVDGEVEVLVCGMTTELGGEGDVTGSVLLADCEGAKVVNFDSDPGLDLAVNEVSFDTVGETGVEGGYTIETWFFPFVPVPPEDTFLYYDDGDGERIAPLCLTDPRDDPGYPDELDPSEFLPVDPEDGPHTTCIIQDIRSPGGIVEGEQFGTADVILLSIGDPARGFR